MILSRVQVRTGVLVLWYNIKYISIIRSKIMSSHYIEMNEWKTVRRRLLFTCLLLIIYVIGTHIPLLSTPNELNIDSTYKMTIANMGGNLDSINIFSLGLGPWLTAMIITMLYYYKFPEKMVKLTQYERSIREKILTLIIAIIQSYFLVRQAYILNPEQPYSQWIAMLVLISGSMLLMWMADINTIRGIAGAMPIVFISIIRSFLSQSSVLFSVGPIIVMFAFIFVLIAFIVLLVLELSEYHIKYEDIMTVSTPYQKPYIAWKLNPSGSLSIMITIALFISLKYFVDLMLHALTLGDYVDTSFISFTNPLGITLFVSMLFVFNFWLSVFMLNPKNKAEMFQKSGNYFIGIQPGKATERFLKDKARKVSFVGAFIVTLIIGIPLFTTLLYPKSSVEIILSIQIIMVVYIALNMVESVKTLLYFDRYEGFLKRYW